MLNYGLAAVSDFLGDFIVYRNLAPADPRLPGLAALRPELDLPPGYLPRKTEPDYGRVVTRMLLAASQIERSGEIRRLIFLGDTRLLDATAFANTARAGGWPGVAFIGGENTKPPQVEVEAFDPQRSLYLCNRWAGLHDFEGYCQGNGFPFDENTAVLIDLDKTAVGARGRNAAVIDAARVEAVRVTVTDLLGSQFQEAAFQSAYDQLNQPEFHTFTADNQDYLAYICLILGSGLFDLPTVVSQVREGRLGSFTQFIDQVDTLASRLPDGLTAIHRSIYANVLAGDPTPFKTFRWNEYHITIRRFGHLPDTTPVEALLAEEIVITAEVHQKAKQWKEQGALIFGLSDKPDEASCPPPGLEAQGYAPIHRTPTHSVGS